MSYDISETQYFLETRPVEPGIARNKVDTIGKEKYTGLGGSGPTNPNADPPLPATLKVWYKR